MVPEGREEYVVLGELGESLHARQAAQAAVVVEHDVPLPPANIYMWIGKVLLLLHSYRALYGRVCGLFFSSGAKTHLRIVVMVNTELRFRSEVCSTFSVDRFCSFVF